jgi:hypothetical protein
MVTCEEMDENDEYLASILDAHNISKKKTNAKKTNEVCNFTIKNVAIIRNVATSI